MRSASVLPALVTVVLAAGCNGGGDLVGVDGSVPPAFASAAECGVCHPDQLADWETSMHAYSGVDPVMIALRETAQAEGSLAAILCQSCHTPAQVRWNRRAALGLGGSVGATGDLIEDGLNCDVCHSIADVPGVADIGFLGGLDPSEPKYANMADPVPNTAHESERRDFYGTSVACAPCHEIRMPSGSLLQKTFREWQESNLSGMGVECQTCHMPQYTGRAATGGPVRENLHRHKMVGADYAYGPFRGIDQEQQKEDIRNLLRNSVSVSADVPASAPAGHFLVLRMDVLNDRTGHSVPSGVAFNRQMWIEVTVKDGGGAVLYRSGYLENDGDLVTKAADPDLVSFGATLKDAQGEPTPFTWRAVSVDDSDVLPVFGRRAATYAVPIAAGTAGPLTVELALRFRSMPPALFRRLGLDDLLPIMIVDMWRTTAIVTVIP